MGARSGAGGCRGRVPLGALRSSGALSGRIARAPSEGYIPAMMHRGPGARKHPGRVGQIGNEPAQQQVQHLFKALPTGNPVQRIAPDRQLPGLAIDIRQHGGSNDNVIKSIVDHGESPILFASAARMDAAIATGSNNSSRYFEYYFSKYPNIIRKSRNSVAVLTGVESNDELAKLGFDLFSYFGLGCRNVSKLFVPAGYSFDPLFQAIEKFRSVMIAHHNYMNNYDYNRAVLLLKGIPFLTNDFLIVMEHAQVASPVAMVHYEFYSDENDLTKKLNR